MFQNLKGKLLPAAPLLGVTALLAGNANAVVDTTAIVASITEGQAAAIVVALAFGVAVWAVRGVKMIRRA